MYLFWLPTVFLLLRPSPWTIDDRCAGGASSGEVVNSILVVATHSLSANYRAMSYKHSLEATYRILAAIVAGVLEVREGVDGLLVALQAARVSRP